MKKIFATAVMVCALQFTQAQSWIPVDKSPMDQIYYPIDYPSKKIKGDLKEPLRMRIIYSRPYKNSRPIFGADIVPYGKIWRLGANEATEAEFFTNAIIAGKKVPKGRYTLYAIADAVNWTFIINKDTDAWGAFNYDQKKDVARVSVPVITTDQIIESLTINFEKTNTGVNLVAEWDNKMAKLPISF